VGFKLILLRLNSAMLGLRRVLGKTSNKANNGMHRRVFTGSEKKWDGTGMTQEDFMRKDECIVLDENDNIIDGCNKYKTHQFNTTTPRGVLHRAFSVFLFNSEGKLLLQQRASSKITFPNVWTNTCCSHPLIGQEADSPEDLANGSVPGVKLAAIRKLKHELGIEEEQVKIDQFKFLTRLHYWAADTVTHGKQSPWGEHEIDYVLFIQADVDCKPNPDEVDGIKYVTLSELQKMMEPSSGLLWSPWFRIIVERFLEPWWKDLDTTLNTDKLVDVKTIHRFDPPAIHQGGLGNAGPFLDVRTAFEADKHAEAAIKTDVKKQGAYGKVKTHKESKCSQLMRFDEVFSALQCKFLPPAALDASGSEALLAKDENVEFCNNMLGKVSRSFAAVIRQLPQGLCIEIVVFYLALRALDTIEDDMTAFKDPQVKIDQLQKFFEEGLENPFYNQTGVGEGAEAALLEEFWRVSRVFKSLDAGVQEVIKDITKRMGEGMAEFVSKDLGEGTQTTVEYDRYCHFVAGLVGEGLSRLFSATKLESSVVAQRLDLADSMGKFLQKVNIIRDYLEDYVDGRAFWPKEIWGIYAPTGKLGDFAKPEHREKGLQCLNSLVTNALQHIPECIEYLSTIKNEKVFRFCAIPQVMAIATLEKLYNNEDVFTGVVKIRKGLACKLILGSNDLSQVKSCFADFTRQIMSKIDASDPNALATTAICKRVIRICESSTDEELASAIAKPKPQFRLVNFVAPAVVAFSAMYVGATILF